MNIRAARIRFNDDGPFRCSIEIPPPRTEAGLRRDLDEALGQVVDDGRGGDDRGVQLWLPRVAEAEDGIVEGFGFTPYRDLWQLRISLPSGDSTDIETRPFEAADADEFIAVNNAAFAWHPEQSGMNRQSLTALQAEDWFDPDIFLIHERDGRIAGFNWLKVHPAPTSPEPGEPADAIGEIYVIAVHPEFHGLGLGTKLSVAGLTKLSENGLREAMLYVEADNAAANRVYENLGFHHHQTNRAYRRQTDASADAETP